MATKDLTSLKIAIVHENLTIRGGAEKVLFELHKLFPKATIYTPLYKSEKFPEFMDATIITSWFNNYNFFRNRQQLLVPLMPYAVEQFDLSSYDVVISISTSAAKGVITHPDALHICYCNTPMRWAWMPYLDKRASGSLIRRLSAHYLRLWDVATVSRVDAWVANSRTIATRIKKFYKQDSTVIYPPVHVKSTEINSSNDGYYLTVGRLEDQKRADIIIEAAKKTGVELKVVGSGALEKQLKELANNAKNIEFLGFVSDEKRDELYNNCKAFIFASEEDFGIVPVEAMAFGKPVIAFGRGGASETVIDGKTGLHFSKQTAESLAEVIENFDRHEFDHRAIARHAQQFSAERFSKEITDFIAKKLEDMPSHKA
jgi:glycosyltransferase involved in cell wall biosynthesis